MKTKVRKIGNSYGIVLPKEALQAMKVQEGTELYLTEGAEGALHVTAAAPDFAEAIETAQQSMAEYRNALRELAK